MTRVSLIVTLNKFIIESLSNILSVQTYKYKFEKKQENVRILFFFNSANFVISRNEKSSREARQRLDSHCGVTCEDFSFLEMTNDMLRCVKSV